MSREGSESKERERLILGSGTGDTPHGVAVVLIVVVGRVEIATVEVQVVRVVAIVGSTRPIVTVGACIVERAVIGVNVAGSTRLTGST